MEKLSPAEKALLQAWKDYVHSHQPSFQHKVESDNDTIDRTRLFYLMTEILFDYYAGGAAEPPHPFVSTFSMPSRRNGSRIICSG